MSVFCGRTTRCSAASIRIPPKAISPPGEVPPHDCNQRSPCHESRRNQAPQHANAAENKEPAAKGPFAPLRVNRHVDTPSQTANCEHQYNRKTENRTVDDCSHANRCGGNQSK